MATKDKALKDKLMEGRCNLYQHLGEAIGEAVKNPGRHAVQELRDAMQAVVEVDGFLRRVGVLDAESTTETETVMQVAYVNLC